MINSVNELVENMIGQYFSESDMTDSSVENALSEVKTEISSKYGFETSLKKSTLGGPTSYFLKVFGPKDSWKNNIALNSPLHMTFIIDVEPGKIEMTDNSVPVKRAKAKMRATKFSSEAELKKKLLNYFSKNADKFKELLDGNS